MSDRSITPLPPADFTPVMGNYKTLQPFRYWCQKVLPLVYDDSLSYYELLCKVVDYLNKTMEDVETLHGDVDNLHKAYVELQGYVNNYFSTLDVQAEINNKLNDMASDGTLSRLLSSIINNHESPKFVNNVSGMTDHNSVYVNTTDGYIYYWNGSKFVSSGLSYTTPNNVVTQYHTQVKAENYTSVLPDLNEAHAPVRYILLFALNETNIPLNTPFNNKWGVSESVLFETYYVGPGSVQLFITKKQIYIRRSTATPDNPWGEWSTMIPEVPPASRIVTQYPTQVKAENYTYVLPDLNEAHAPVRYILLFAMNETNIPLNTPFNNKWGVSESVLFETYYAGSGSVQLFITKKQIYIRRSTATPENPWGEWSTMIPEVTTDRTIIVGNNGDYTSLTKAIFDNNGKYSNLTIQLQDGTYNLESEFKDYFGSDFFDNYNTNSQKGLVLNGINLECSTGSKIVFNYTGNNANVKRLFSPINAGKRGFKINGATIECSNCRYCVHDELSGNTTPYSNTYTNCNFKIDNSNNTEWLSRQVIGGGLGYHGNITIDGLICESVGVGDGVGIISYHNNAYSGSKSFIKIVNTYLIKGTIRFSWYGSSTEISYMLVGNNKITSDYIEKGETEDSTIVNAKILKLD